MFELGKKKVSDNNFEAATFLEHKAVRSFMAPFIKKSNDSLSYIFNKAKENIAPEQRSILKTIGRNLMDVGVISSASFLFASLTIGAAPLTALAGLGLGGVIGVRAYQELFTASEDVKPEVLNKKGSIERFIKRPGAAYTLSSLTTMAAVPLLIGLAATGQVAALGAGLVEASKFASVVLFGSVFSVSNNIKAARLDKDRGYDVSPLPFLKNIDPSWSEKLSVIGNIARNFIAGPVIGLITLPFMREALKFSKLDKENEGQGKLSYTDQHLSKDYGWEQPKSDSGMARTMTGLGKVFGAAGALLSGNFSAAASLAYPAVGLFVLSEKSHEAYAVKVNDKFNQAVQGSALQRIRPESFNSLPVDKKYVGLEPANDEAAFVVDSSMPIVVTPMRYNGLSVGRRHYGLVASPMPQAAA